MIRHETEVAAANGRERVDSACRNCRFPLPVRSAREVQRPQCPLSSDDFPRRRRGAEHFCQNLPDERNRFLRGQIAETT